MDIIVHQSIAEIEPDQWNSMLDSDNPFMRHEFLHGLELCSCVSELSGWQPSHIAIYSDSSQRRLLAAMPCYIKKHSYGEYIFDWSWADAHHRHGFEYYPKLSNAIPFTPATGERWLCDSESDQDSLKEKLFEKALSITKEQGLSSFHSLFLTEQQKEKIDKKHTISLAK